MSEIDTMLYGDDHSVSARKRDFLHKYTRPGDRFLLGGWMTVLYSIWLLVVPVILHFLQLWYVLQWQFLVTIILSWIEAGLVLICACVATWLAVWADADVHRLMHVNFDIESRNNVTYMTLQDAKRSRANASTDLSLLLGGTLFNIFEITIVMMFWLGSNASPWLSTGGATAVTAQAVLNNPLTNSTAWTFNAQSVQEVNYYSEVHRFIFYKGLILLVAILFTRHQAVELRHACVTLEHEAMERGGRGAPVDNETAVRLGKMMASQQKDVSASNGVGGNLIHIHSHA